MKGGRVCLAVLGALSASVPCVAGPVGSIFAVNTFTTGTQDSPVAMADGSGNVTVVWVSQADGAQDGDAAGIVARRFDPNGAALTAEVPVNTTTTGAQTAPALAGTEAGNFIVVWESDGQDGDGAGVFGQRFAANGTLLGTEFQVNTYTTGAQREPAVAVGSGGEFVVSWTSDGQDGDGAGIFAQRFDSGGTPLGGEFQVNPYTTSDQDQSSVAILPTGESLIVWSSDHSAPIYAAMRGVYGQLYDAAGLPIGGELVVSEGSWDQVLPVVLPGVGQAFTILVQDSFYDGRLAVIDTTGVPLFNYTVPWGEGVGFDDAGNLLVAGSGYTWWFTEPLTIYSAGVVDGPAAILPSTGLGGGGLKAAGAFGDQEFLAIGVLNGELIGRRFTNCRDPGFGPPCSDHPIAARKVAISKRYPGKVKFVSLDPTFPFPAFGGPDDPRNVGMSVSLVTPGRVHTTSVPAIPGLWITTDAAVDKYVYRRGGEDYRVAVKLQDGLRITLRIPDPLVFVPPVGTLGVRIQLGDTRMCAFFEGPAVRADTPQKFTGVQAPVGGLVDCSDQSLGLL